MKINVGKTGAQNILDLVKDANPSLVLFANQFTLGLPAAVVGTADRNTEVVLTAVDGAGKAGTKTVAYTRLNPVTGPNAGAATVGVEVAADATDAQIKLQLTALFGLVFDDVELLTFTLPTEGVDGTANLAAVATSLLYVGNSDIKLVLPAEQPEDLDTAIAVSDLNGFEAETA